MIAKPFALEEEKKKAFETGCISFPFYDLLRSIFNGISEKIFIYLLNESFMTLFSGNLFYKVILNLLVCTFINSTSFFSKLILLQNFLTMSCFIDDLFYWFLRKMKNYSVKNNKILWMFKNIINDYVSLLNTRNNKTYGNVIVRYGKIFRLSQVPFSQDLLYKNSLYDVIIN